MLADLGFKDADIRTKPSIRERMIGKGKVRRSYKPDYVVSIGKDPTIVIDAKAPEEVPDQGLADAQLYARDLNGDYIGRNPVQYCIGTNGAVTLISRWDENKSFLEMRFESFTDSDADYQQFRWTLSKSELAELLRSLEPAARVAGFEFRKPDVSELKGVFTACHNLIWRKQRIDPPAAFYEFAKILFVKLREDRTIRRKLDRGEAVSPDDFVFSLNWIDRQKVDENPINNQLFVRLRDELEDKVEKGVKKRIFGADERLELNPPVIREVVRLLEHLDLFSVDEDLNGRIFETFLGATVRGKALGQFFTPRSVVEFMVGLADLQVDPPRHIDFVLDGCCGTGGFLIYAMRNMLDKLEAKRTLSNLEKEEICDRIRGGQLYGVDDNERMIRVCRMNMYVHGDGGSYIYKLDFLDKNYMKIQDERDKEIRKNALEFRDRVSKDGLSFDVVLTNPPFAMKYEKTDRVERGIMQEYDTAYLDLNASGARDSTKLRASLKSNIMFLERYLDFLKPHGTLITVIDESILNTEGQGKAMVRFRQWLRSGYLIKAVISLPQNTFVNADVNPKTSVLSLVKKKEPQEKQPDVFMAIAQNVGHNDAGRPTPQRNDLPHILEEFRKFERGKS
jgi:type I restriction enzyme M protein